MYIYWLLGQKLVSVVHLFLKVILDAWCADGEGQLVWIGLLGKTIGL